MVLEPRYLEASHGSTFGLALLRTRMAYPYADAPRLPDEPRVDVRALVTGGWVELEIGPGRGWFLVERAAAEPVAALLGLEVRRKWAAIVDGRLAKRGLAARARVFAEDARHALPRLGPDASVRRVFLHFPDPWWKKRHRKRLVMRDDFVAEVVRLLEPQGELFVQTDVQERACAYEDIVALDSRLEPAGDGDGSPRLVDHAYVARSPRERRAIADGLPVYRIRWRRSAARARRLLGPGLERRRGTAARKSARLPVLHEHGMPLPHLVVGPYLTDLSDGHVEVRFELDAPAPASVVLGGADGASAAIDREDSSSAMHVVRVAGLHASMPYAYAVRAGGAELGHGRFTTAPEPASGASTTFLLYGDDRSDPEAHAAVVHELQATPSDFLVNTGDAVENGGRASDWLTFFQIEAPVLADRALFLCIGNHELVDDQAGANFGKYVGFRDARGTTAPYGTMRWSGVRFFFLNGMHDWTGGDERAWLERELASADGEPGVRWRIAVVHHGPWASGPHGDNAKLMAAHVPELLVAHHVDLVLSGHDHIYERGESGPLKYIVSGGGGAPLYPIRTVLPTTRKAKSAYHVVAVTASTDAIRIETKGVDGTVIDACGFPKGGSWDCDPPPTVPATAVSPAAAPPSSTSSSRCGCRGVGTPVPDDAAWLLAAGAVLGGGAARRRRARQLIAVATDRYDRPR